MNELVFYILIAIMLGLIGIVLMFVRAYIKLHDELIKLQKQNLYLKTQDAGKAEQILAEAHDRAIIIIDQANKKATDLISRAQTIDTNAAKTLESKLQEASSLHAQELKNASKDLLAVYKDALTKIQSEDIQNATSLSKNINEITTQELGQFKETLEKETIASQKLVDEKVTKEYQAIEEEIKAYRTNRLAQVDNSILQIIQSVTETVLQKQLSVSDQEQLVYDALTKLKHAQERA